MRYRPEHKADARAHLIAALGRGFRRHGFGGIGVGLAKEAQAKSGASCAHKRTCEAGDSLSPEVERADVATREVYEASIDRDVSNKIAKSIKAAALQVAREEASC